MDCNWDSLWFLTQLPANQLTPMAHPMAPGKKNQNPEESYDWRPMEKKTRKLGDRKQGFDYSFTLWYLT